MKSLNQIPALIGFGLGCIIIFISWLVSTIYLGVSSLIKTTTSLSAKNTQSYRGFKPGEATTASNFFATTRN